MQPGIARWLTSDSAKATPTTPYAMLLAVASLLGPHRTGKMLHKMTSSSPQPGKPAPGGGLVPEIRARLWVSSKVLTPEEVTARVGVEPRSTQHVGDPLVAGLSDVPMRVHTWEGPFARGDAWQLESFLLDLLDSLEPHQEAVNELQQVPDTKVSLLVGVSLFDFEEVVRTPGFGLSHEALTRLAAFGVPLDCDVNVVGGD